MPIQVLLAVLVLATARGCEATCDGLFQLRVALSTNKGGLADALRGCIAPLLFAPRQWLSGDQAREFCDTEACKESVQQLRKLPACTWGSESPSGSDANTLALAVQVMHDCGSELPIE